MTLPTMLACAITCCGVAVAQRPARLVPLRGVFDAVQNRDGVEGRNSAAERLRTMLTSLLATNDVALPQQAPRLVQLLKGRDAMVIQGTREDFELVDGILKQLRQSDHPELRVQCTILTMPSKLAATHGLARGTPRPVDEAAAGKILKQCIAQGGTLKNLPECSGLPLQPFVIRPRDDGQPIPGYAVDCEAVMLDPDNAALTVRLMEDPQRQGAPRAERILETCRLEVGAGVMLASRPQQRAPQPDQTIVLWLRLVSAEVPATPLPARKH